MHPGVYRQIADWFESLAGAGGSVRPPTLGIADIPLLYETGHEGDFDRVIVAACPPAQQVERLVARGWSEEDARQRMSAQWPIEEKVRRADYVIDTSGTQDETDRRVLEVSERLQ